LSDILYMLLLNHLLVPDIADYSINRGYQVRLYLLGDVCLEHSWEDSDHCQDSNSESRYNIVIGNMRDSHQDMQHNMKLLHQNNMIIEDSL
jgi:molybdenum cofactor biosynthesis enzyme MoaA